MVADDDDDDARRGGGAAVVRLAPGDVLLMKGGLWERGAHGGGAAHRAPAIGPVPTCTAFRLMLKVDVCEDFW